MLKRGQLTENRRHRIDLVDRLDHVAQLKLVGRRANGQARYTTEIREIKTAMVCWPIVADEASAVQNEPHGQLLNGAIMDDLRT